MGCEIVFFCALLGNGVLDLPGINCEQLPLAFGKGRGIQYLHGFRMFENVMFLSTPSLIGRHRCLASPDVPDLAISPGGVAAIGAFRCLVPGAWAGLRGGWGHRVMSVIVGVFVNLVSGWVFFPLIRPILYLVCLDGF